MSNLIEKTPNSYEFPLLIKRLLDYPLVTSSKNEIVYRDKVRYGYPTFAQRVGRLANALTALGVKPGHTVAVMDWDSHRYLECFFAVPMLGAVLHTVNIRLSPDQILYTINHAEDDVILVNAEFLPVLEQIRDRIETAKVFVLLTDEETWPITSVEFAKEYEAMLAENPHEFDFQDFDENTRATTFYTTGTTGLPKGVYFSHRQLVLHTLSTIAGVSTPKTQGRFHRDDVYMPITPMFHVHAWGMPYVATLLGVKQIYPGRYTPDHLLGLIKKEKVTYSHCVPTILHMLLNHPMAAEVDLSNLKMVIGGAALPNGLCKAALARGIDIFAGYGMSETCPILCLSLLDTEMLEWDMDRQAAMRGKTGRPIPLTEMRIVDEEMGFLPHDGQCAGEIVTRSPWLTMGYFKDEKNSEQLWRGGYLHTADVSTIDQMGYLQICDRIKDVIKTGGEWISSLELEDLVSRHPSVSEVAVIGISDPKWGERPMALVVAKPDYAGKVTEEELKAHVQEFANQGVISKWGVPSKFLFVSEIDKTSVGKINKKLLRQKYQQ